jgi:hypothetical protein
MSYFFVWLMHTFPKLEEGDMFMISENVVEEIMHNEL